MDSIRLEKIGDHCHQRILTNVNSVRSKELQNVDDNRGNG